MKLKALEIEGYRSLRDFHLKPGRITVCVGANGSGKSNIYNSLKLLQAAARGDLARRIVAEGGMDSIMWAGEESSEETGKLRIKIRSKNIEYMLRLGFVPKSDVMDDGDMGPGLSFFSRDPDIKFEKIDFLNNGKSTSLLKRKRTSVVARNMEGRSAPYAIPMAGSESVLYALKEPQKFPEIYKLRSDLDSWRFYYDFRTDLDSPIRRPHRATLTPIMNDDGHDLASAIATIFAVGDEERFKNLVDEAFPGSAIELNEEDGLLELSVVTPGLRRTMSSRELSDGTLQFLLLMAALLTPRPAPFIVLNEPETSIHEDLIESLAMLIKEAAKRSQVLVTTHSHKLARLLKKEPGCRFFELNKEEGETKIKGQSLDELPDYEDDEDQKEEVDDLMENFEDDEDDDD